MATLTATVDKKAAIRHSFHGGQKRRNPQKTRAFQASDTYGHCIKDNVLIDPAAGSGNFLTESYLCLRKLENETISLLTHGQISFGEVKNPIKVSIGQFYGIEINDFAATVAKTALWIAESQMMKHTEDVVHMPLDFLPLKSYVNIVEGNALRIDWNGVVPKEKLSYIMGIICSSSLNVINDNIDEVNLLVA